MENKNVIIIILICVIAVLIAYLAVSGMSSNPNQNASNVNNTTQSLTVDKVSQNDESSSSSSSSSDSSSNGGIHKEHLNGGDVAVDSNGMVVGHYNSKGEYIQGGQLAGSTIEDARAFDEHVSKYGMQ